jgi:heptosyltransferase-1
METEPSAILIIRLSAIGDVVFASPLIKALRLSYPEAKISWLVEPAAAPLLQHNPDLDEVILWPKAEWQALWRQGKFISLWRELRALIARLKAHRFDLAIDLQGLLKSALWARFSAAPERIGLGSKEGSQRLMTQVVSRHDDSHRIGAEYLLLAREMGLDVTQFEMDIALSAEDEAFPTTVIPQQKYAVICPFTTRPQKHWVESRWPELAVQIEALLGLPVVMLGGPADQAAAARIVAANGNIIDMAGKTSLSQSAALIKHASLLVGVDTGLTHMGIAFNVPTLALFGSTCPYRDTTRANARVLYHQLECSPCRRNPTCDGDFTCMKMITVEEIMRNAREVMA